MKILFAPLLIALLSSFAVSVQAESTPEQDKIAYQKYFQKKFPKTPMADFVNGVYSVHPESRAQWEEIEEFPPYEIAIEEGEVEFNKAFANGKTYSDCFANSPAKSRKDFPYFDTELGQVVTLEYAINRCREANGEKPLKYKKGKMVNLSAYMAYESRGEKIDVKIQNDAAKAAYESGKQFYYTKRGQLNFSCMDCHGAASGLRVRADTLSPGLGHTSHFPVYRSKWGGMGTLHRRFAGCNKNIRAQPLKAQSEAYRNLEYFLSYMGNGLELNGPGARK
ncbi:MAG: sulfur oxidation c-type cytochrome SoxA [Arenicella sp.]